MEKLSFPPPYNPEFGWGYDPVERATTTVSSQKSFQSTTAADDAANVAAFSKVWNATIKKAAASKSQNPQQVLPFECYIKAILPIRLALLHPYTWTKEDVAVFLLWCRREFNLPPIDLDGFKMDGTEFCLLKKQDFQSKAPDSGDVIYNIFEFLTDMQYLDFSMTPCISSQLGQKGATSSVADIIPPQLSQSIACIEISPILSEQSVNNEGNCASAKISLPRAKLNSGTTSVAVNYARNNNSTIRLWEFLLQALNDPAQKHSSLVTWKNSKRKIFKIVDPQGLALRWGIEKGHLNMTYAKMSRSLRYYYKMKILQRIPGELLCFRFL